MNRGRNTSLTDFCNDIIAMLVIGALIIVVIIFLIRANTPETESIEKETSLIHYSNVTEQLYNNTNYLYEIPYFL